MATSCKLVFGYTDHTDEWISEKCYYRHYDGYPESVIDLLKAYKCDVAEMNEIAKYSGHRFEELENIHDGVNGVDYIYYVDMSNLNCIKVSVLGLDMEFYLKFGIDNYKVEMECEL